MNEVKKAKFLWWRALLCAILACIVMVILFDLHTGIVAEIISDFSVKDEANLIWLFNHVSAGIPIFALIAIINLFYMDKQRCVPVYTPLEKLIVFIVTALFIFVIMLPSVRGISESAKLIQESMSIDSTVNYDELGLLYQLFPTDKDPLEFMATLWDNNYMWFFAQILPLLIVISYHGIRISGEKSERAEDDQMPCEMACEDEDDEDADYVEEEKNIKDKDKK